VKQELVERYSSDSLTVFIVWSPMMPGDNEDAAREAAAMFDKANVTQFYDASRGVGNAFRHDVFPDAYEKAFASLPPDHWLRESMPQMKSRYATSPEWDIYMFFDGDAEWKRVPPHPTRFVRHLGRVIEKDDERLSIMWINGYGSPPVEGTLPSEVGRLAHELLRTPEPVRQGAVNEE
jgi:hypothetical protein